MEICVNEYVRTWDGIKKIVKINEGKDITIHGKYIVEPQYKNSSSISANNILKHSPNIIDLIEVGDYVISEDGIEGKVEFVMLPLKIFIDGEEVLNDEIKSIVTKEMFNQVKSEV